VDLFPQPHELGYNTIFRLSKFFPMATTTKKNALVIGGSMAGLLTARVLSDHFEQVTLVERDKMQDHPEARKGQPQTRHLHALLSRGFQVMRHYFPDLPQGLKKQGSLIVDVAKNMRWYCYGGYRARFDLGIDAVITDRCILEWQVRQRVVALSNVKVLDGYGVNKLLTKGDQQQVVGVELSPAGDKENGKEISADLVVDCGGRGSKSPKWLGDLGYRKPAESVVTCGTGYATRLYHRGPEEGSLPDWVFITPEAPREYLGGAAFPVEGNRWMVSLGGWHGHHAPTDEAGYLAFAKSLPAPDVYEIASRSKPVSDIFTYKFPASLRRHYEQLTHFPNGLLVLGDAVCSFNPLYGQGMTSAALQAECLDQLLQEKQGTFQGIAKSYFKRVAKIVDVPWQTAVGEDFRFPETKGKKALGTDLVNWYVAKVHRATHHDPVVGAAFLKVMGMLEPPARLFQPNILWRVFRSNLLKSVA
jgi:2-polyprenyl-6-methoxyphenol hydroxylase-like FAD-dependent oxidoreductase